jgi:hypothetical protein
MTRLPAGGRKGRIPNWPLIDDVRKAALLDVAEGTITRLREELRDPELYGAARASRERKLQAAEVEVAVLTRQLAAQRGLETKLWREVWKTPQAVAWERLGYLNEIGQYVRWKVARRAGRAAGVEGSPSARRPAGSDAGVAAASAVGGRARRSGRQARRSAAAPPAGGRSPAKKGEPPK